MARSPLREMSGLDDEEFDRQKEVAEKFLVNTGVMAQMICSFDSEMAEAVMSAYGSYDTIVSMFDPTRYMQEAPQARANANMTKIILDAKKKLTEMGICRPV